MHDSHAEVLVRRCLVRCLGEHLRAALADELPASDSHANWLEAVPPGPHEDSAGYRLRPHLRLHLYISEPPCGDAAIYPLLAQHATAADTASPHLHKQHTGSSSSPIVAIATHDVAEPPTKRQRCVASDGPAAVTAAAVEAASHTSCDNSCSHNAGNEGSVTSNDGAAAVHKFSGAKLLSLAHEGEQALGQLRLKCGRSNLRDVDRTQR